MSKSTTEHTSKGLETRQRILATAMDLATKEGLEPLSIAKLAKATDMSKAGLFGHFGSKEELQVAVIQAAGADFTEKVIAPRRDETRGLVRLRDLMRGWMLYTAKRDKCGGCFFFAIAAEFDDRPGPVRDAIAAMNDSWLRMLRGEIHAAIRAGEIREDVDASQLTFELHAMALEGNWGRRLFRWDDALDRASRAMQGCLERVATDRGKELLGAESAQAKS